MSMLILIKVGLIPTLLLSLLLIVSARAATVVVTPAELAEARRWSAAKFEGVQPAAPAEPALVVLANHGLVQKNARGDRAMHIVDTVDSAEPPFSFLYGGKASAVLLKEWPCQRASRKLDEQRTERTSTWTDPATGLEVRCVGIEYNDFPTVEWVVHFKNTGTNDTPLLSDIQGVDLGLVRSGSGEFILNHHAGRQLQPGQLCAPPVNLEPEIRASLRPRRRPADERGLSRTSTSSGPARGSSSSSAGRASGRRSLPVTRATACACAAGRN